jgi:hypothetical protein
MSSGVGPTSTHPRKGGTCSSRFLTGLVSSGILANWRIQREPLNDNRPGRQNGGRVTGTDRHTLLFRRLLHVFRSQFPSSCSGPISCVVQAAFPRELIYVRCLTNYASRSPILRLPLLPDDSVNNGLGVRPFRRTHAFSKSIPRAIRSQ